ncbi:uncharacterized protein LOC120282133 [Dioscorea cayenensis subsp. rotundata]|uniref:Uncharacterized protein LOC120282133 n=1 Tax=Dioscorea cayennensis subsp. rotundata TaxID=55577 RepID=A0AB40CZI0_DIOCR|nr:uncharacterized protein LOC120282133 [Dioscorea cayenensis subsp. rotundata]
MAQSKKGSSSSSSSAAAAAGKGFTRRCASLVKEQRARIYILRRCATMLLCWYIHGDD